MRRLAEGARARGGRGAHGVLRLERRRLGRLLSACLAALLVATTLPLAAARQNSAGEPLLSGIPRSEYRARRKAAMAALPDGLIVLRGSVEEDSGDHARFRQNNWFFYLTGVEEPGAYVLLDPFAPEGSREVLYLPARDMMRERWDGPRIGPGTEAAARLGFDAVRPSGDVLDDVAAAVTRHGAARGGKIYTVVPGGAGARFTRDAAFAEELGARIPASLASSWAVADARRAIADLRRTKSAAEVALLERAVAITADAQREVARAAAPGRFEYEAEAAIAATFLRNGALRAGFPSIVGSGIYSTVLHYSTNTKRMEEGDLVVVDIGAEYGYYTADVTRTWPVSGKFTPRQREVYTLVLETQRAAERAYKPGMSIRDLNAVAREHMRKSPLRDREGRTLDSAFIHGLSHYLGMDVHDVGDPASPLRPGDVFTIEPGIYLPDERLGVRIEDDYVVTETGLVKLSRDLPSDPDEIERMMRKDRDR